MSERRMIEIAREVAKSRPVFPLREHGKAPRIAKASGGRGLHDATQDEAKIEEWFSLKYPKANIGVPVAADELVLDLDLYKPGASESLDKLVELSGHDEFAEWPVTRMHRTGRGGIQLFFRLDCDPATLNGDTGLFGIDVRKLGNYVAWPGSVLKEGTYEVMDDREPIPAPKWLIDLLTRPVSSNGRVATPMFDDVIRIGEIDTELASRAGKMRDALSADEDEIFAYLKSLEPKIERGHTHTDKDFRRIARSISRYAPGADLRPPIEATTPTTAKVDGVVPDSGFFRAAIDAVRYKTEAGEEALFAVLLASLAGMVGWRARVEFGRSAEPMSIYTVTQGSSATARKTTGAYSVEDMIRDAGVEWIRMRALGHVSDRGLIDLLAAQTEFGEFDEPVESLVAVIDEIGSILSATGNDFRAHARRVLLAAYMGRHPGIDTGPRKVPPGKCCLSIVGTVTRDELARNATVEAIASGSLGRLLIMPESDLDPADLKAIPPTLTPEQKAHGDAVVAWLRELAAAIGIEEHDFGDIFGMLDDDAKALREDWYRTNKIKLDGLALQLFDRLQIVAVKVAFLLALADWKPGEALRDLRITRAHVDRGQRLADLSRATVLELVEEQEPTGEDAFLDKCEARMRELAAESDAPVTVTSLARSVWAPKNGGRQLTQAEKRAAIERDPRFAISQGRQVGSNVVRLAEEDAT